MLAVSTISTRKVLCPRARLSWAPDARQDAVDQPDARRARGDEGADLRQDHEERGLAHEHALAAHVRPGEDDELARRRDRGVTSLGVNGAPPAASSTGWRPSAISIGLAVVHTGRTWPRAWATSASPASASSAATARAARRSASRLRRRPGARTSTNSSSSSARDALLRAQHAALVLLQLRGDVALGADQRLAPDVVGGHLGRRARCCTSIA